MARRALGMPTVGIARLAIDWARRKVQPDGWLGESRGASTIYYTRRCAVVLLFGQCLMRKLGHPLLSGEAQANLARTIDRLEAVLSRGKKVRPPTMFHERSGYAGEMSNNSPGDIRALRQMYAYAFQGASLGTLVDTKYVRGSFTYGDLRTVLESL